MWYRYVRRKIYEANISTEKEKKSNNTWLFNAIKYSWGKKCVEAKESSGKKKTHRLIMVGGKYLVVKKGGHSSSGRLCFFSISKKTFKTATERNKIKRQVRAIMRSSSLFPKNATTIIPKEAIKTASFSDIEKELRILLEH